MGRLMGMEDVLAHETDYLCFVWVRPPGPEDPGIELSETPPICRGCVDEDTGCDSAQVAECYRREESDAAYASEEDTP